MNQYTSWFLLSLLFEVSTSAEPLVRPLARRIIGGEATKSEQVPYQVLITLENGQQLQRRNEGQGGANDLLCAGSIVAYDTVLTAAHCVPNQDANKYSITGKIDDPEKANQKNKDKLRPNKIIRHEKFDPKMYYNDIAVIKVEPDPNAPVIKIDLDKKASKTILSISGWGAGTDTGLATPIKHLELEIQEPSKCDNEFKNQFVSEKEICVEGLQQKGTLCHGDSGSPVVYKDKLVGVVSYGSIPCSYKKIGVIQNISSYMDWIQIHVPSLGKGHEYSTNTTTSSTSTNSNDSNDSSTSKGNQRESHLNKNQDNEFPSEVNTKVGQDDLQSRNKNSQSVNPEIQHYKQNSNQGIESNPTSEDRSTPDQSNMQPEDQKESISSPEENQWPQDKVNLPPNQGREPSQISEPQSSSEQNYRHPQEQEYNEGSYQDSENFQDTDRQPFTQDENSQSEGYRGQPSQYIDQGDQRSQGSQSHEYQPEDEQDIRQLPKSSQNPINPNMETIVDPEVKDPQSSQKSHVSFSSPVASYSYEL